MISADLTAMRHETPLAVGRGYQAEENELKNQNHKVHDFTYAFSA